LRKEKIGNRVKGIRLESFHHQSDFSALEIQGTGFYLGTGGDSLFVTG
jgi:hypothetical protein